jgi:hypothetical protein
VRTPMVPACQLADSVAVAPFFGRIERQHLSTQCVSCVECSRDDGDVRLFRAGGCICSSASTKECLQPSCAVMAMRYNLCAGGALRDCFEL